jgi:hypothetical protein
MSTSTLPSHDTVKYDYYDIMMDSIENRYEEGDLKCTRLYHSEFCDVPVEKLDKDREWVFYRVYKSWHEFDKDEKLISLKICPDTTGVLLPYEDTDYIFPLTKRAYLSKSRTEKLRRRRTAKPAYMGKKEEEE